MECYLVLFSVFLWRFSATGEVFGLSTKQCIRERACKCISFSSEKWSRFLRRFDRQTGDSIQNSLSLIDCQGGRPQTSLMAQKDQNATQKVTERLKCNTIHFLMEKNAMTIDCFRAAFVSTGYLC